ncbi:MAG: vitamin K epoxide reductase family protein [Candidatus Yanofskybacteria bacterium]|nr:vitamin K epoxide reductase family protein [Candidatus Yanofskybacteria bacterium]
MTLLSQLWNRKIEKVVWYLVPVLIFSFLGFLDAAYLTATHYLQAPVGCSLIAECDTVLTSAYAEMFGIPIALFGALYYTALFGITLALLDAKRLLVFMVLGLASGTGFLVSLVLIGIQMFLLEAYCQFCLLSAGISIAIFLILFLMFWKRVYSRVF